jgi:4-carboxymuconolactone decarboxylase
VTATESPRLALRTAADWDDDARAALRASFPGDVGERFLSDGPDAIRVPNAIATMLHHPRLAGAFLSYNGVLLFDPALEARLRELVVLRVASRTRAPYEWEQHVRLSKRCGITDDEIATVARANDAGKWSPLEADVLAATDQLIDGYRVDDATWKRLAAQLDARQLVELLFVVGTYTCLAMVFNSFALDLDPDLQPAPAPPWAAAEE